MKDNDTAMGQCYFDREMSILILKNYNTEDSNYSYLVLRMMKIISKL